MRLKIPTALRGPDGSPLDVENVPRLIVGDLPEVLEPADPAAPPPKAMPPVVFNGRIDPPRPDLRYDPNLRRPDPPGDEDRFTVAVTPGRRYRVLVAARTIGSALRPDLSVVDAHGNTLQSRRLFPGFALEGQPEERCSVISAGDGLPEHAIYDPAIEFTAPEKQSEVTLTVSGDWGDGYADTPYVQRRYLRYLRCGRAYRMTVVPVTPSFSIALDDAQVNVPRGGTAAVGVTVTRDGYDGPITLRVIDPPRGLTVRAGSIAEGQVLGALTLTAAADATFGPTVLRAVGEAMGNSRPIVTEATKVLVFGPPVTVAYKVEVDANLFMHYPAVLRANYPVQPGLFATAVKAYPLHLDAPAGPIDVRRGSRTIFKVRVNRSQEAVGPLTLRPLRLPAGVSIPAVDLGAAATEAAVAVHVTDAHPPGMVTIVLTARGKIAGADWGFTVPAVTLRVLPSVAIDPTAGRSLPTP